MYTYSDLRANTGHDTLQNSKIMIDEIYSVKKYDVSRETGQSIFGSLPVISYRRFEAYLVLRGKVVD